MRLLPGIACNLDFMLGTACHMKSYLLATGFIFLIHFRLIQLLILIHLKLQVSVKYTEHFSCNSH